MQKEFNLIKESADFLKKKIPGKIPETLVVLGSGFKAFAESLKPEFTIALAEVPNFKAPKVQGHGGNLIVANVANSPVAIMDGRIHLYEGYSAKEIVRPLRTLAMLGVKKVILTNAAGGLSKDLSPGEVLVLRDQINLSGHSSLVESDGFGPQFVDMVNCYDATWRKKISEATKLRDGVYIGLLGPAYETPAETKMFAAFGGNAVGMSTVNETLAARQMGLKVAGLTLVTNLAGGLSSEVSHNDVLATAKAKAEKLSEILSKVIATSFQI